LASLPSSSLSLDVTVEIGTKQKNTVSTSIQHPPGVYKHIDGIINQISSTLDITLLN